MNETNADSVSPAGADIKRTANKRFNISSCHDGVYVVDVTVGLDSYHCSREGIVHFSMQSNIFSHFLHIPLSDAVLLRDCLSAEIEHLSAELQKASGDDKVKGADE